MSPASISTCLITCSSFFSFGTITTFFCSTINFNHGKICCRSFPNLNLRLHLLLMNITLNQCTIFNTASVVELPGSFLFIFPFLLLFCFLWIVTIHCNFSFYIATPSNGGGGVGCRHHCCSYK